VEKLNPHFLKYFLRT